MEITADLYRVTRTLTFKTPRLIVCWYEEPGGLGGHVIDTINRQGGIQAFCDLEPAGFFPLGGVPVRQAVACFPQSRFWGEPSKDLVTFLSHKPAYARQTFAETLLDVAEHYCHVRELIVISGLLTSGDYRGPRQCHAVFNQPALQKQWRPYGLDNMSYQQVPGLSTYLLWAAGKREIPGAHIRADVPFYLNGPGDPLTVQTVLQLLSDRLEIELDLTDLDQDIETQHQQLDLLRSQESGVDETFCNLENGLSISQEDQDTLIRTVNQTLGHHAQD